MVETKAIRFLTAVVGLHRSTLTPSAKTELAAARCFAMAEC